jgi:DNA repair photolyase
MTTAATTEDGISTGPRTLLLMPAEQQESLDPYMAQIVTYRKSGLSLNHIIGCPLDCGYCVRHFWGNFEVKTPQLLVSTAEAVEMLVGHVGFRPHVTPIQIFNKATDPFLPGVKPHLFAALRDMDDRGLTNLVLLITRFRVTEQDMAELEKLRNLRVTLLFTYSGIADARVEPIAKSRITLTSLATACRASERTKVILYWRPIVPGWNDDPDTMAGVLRAGSGADAIVFTGYYHKEENAAYLRSLGVDVPYADDDFARRKVMPAELDEKVITAWRDSGATTPLFRKTSCGVSFVHGVPDYNGHWGVNELCDICPVQQRTLCRDAHQVPTEEQLRGLLDELGYITPTMLDGGHVWTHGLTEQQRYPIQHILGYQVWDLDLPHFAHAHGRSLTGYQPDETERAKLADVRDEFTHHARFDDD